MNYMSVIALVPMLTSLFLMGLGIYALILAIRCMQKYLGDR